jgi:hypothetical protein
LFKWNFQQGQTQPSIESPGFILPTNAGLGTVTDILAGKPGTLTGFLKAVMEDH